MSDNPYIRMENPDAPRVQDFIESENKRFKGFVGDLSKELEDEVKWYFYTKTLIQAMLTSDGLSLQ